MFLLRVRPRGNIRGRKGGAVHNRKQAIVTGICFVTAQGNYEHCSSLGLNTGGLHIDIHLYQSLFLSLQIFSIARP